MTGPTDMIGPGQPCPLCGEVYGGHTTFCPVTERKNRPRRFRLRVEPPRHPNGSASEYRYGCYFPMTDLVVGDMGGRGTGKPEGVEWLDGESS
jgi:hypothetical protein